MVIIAAKSVITSLALQSQTKRMVNTSIALFAAKNFMLAGLGFLKFIAAQNAKELILGFQTIPVKFVEKSLSQEWDAKISHAALVNVGIFTEESTKLVIVKYAVKNFTQAKKIQGFVRRNVRMHGKAEIKQIMYVIFAENHFSGLHQDHCVTMLSIALLGVTIKTPKQLSVWPLWWRTNKK